LQQPTQTPLQEAFDALSMSNDTDDTEFGDFVGASKPGSGKTTGPIKPSFSSNTPIDTKHVSPKPQQTTQTNTTPVPQKNLLN